MIDLTKSLGLAAAVLVIVVVFVGYLIKSRR